MLETLALGKILKLSAVNLRPRKVLPISEPAVFTDEVRL